MKKNQNVIDRKHRRVRTRNGYSVTPSVQRHSYDRMKQSDIFQLTNKIEADEIIPTFPPVPNTDISAYYQLIERRFSNPKIADTIRRLCLDGSNRQPKFILPPTLERIDTGLPVVGLALESALWCRYCFGTTDSGATIAPNDPIWERLQSNARTARSDPNAWLAMQDIYGECAKSPVFQSAFAHALKTLWEHGTQETLKRYIANTL